MRVLLYYVNHSCDANAIASPHQHKTTTQQITMHRSTFYIDYTIRIPNIALAVLYHFPPRRPKKKTQPGFSHEAIWKVWSTAIAFALTLFKCARREMATNISHKHVSCANCHSIFPNDQQEPLFFGVKYFSVSIKKTQCYKTNVRVSVKGQNILQMI